MSTEPLMWAVEWTEHYAHGTGSRKRNYTFRPCRDCADISSTLTAT
jgi:hypothetical protein